MKCLKEKCIHHDVCALYTFSGYASDECGFYETKPHVENEKQQWIPCTDRLPDKDGDYIATYTFCDKQVVNKVHYSKHLGFFYNSVIAWMPLPTPYMKEGDRNDG